MADLVTLQRAFRRIAEQRIREAMELGAFDNLPGQGRPIPDLDLPYDPDWWIKKWLARERSEPRPRGTEARLAKVALVEELRRPPLVSRQGCGSRWDGRASRRAPGAPPPRSGG